MSVLDSLTAQLQHLNPRLPVPDAVAAAHHERLCTVLSSRIRTDGPMPFSAFMNALLYTPGLGYYSAGSTKFGAAGDFVTAPEMSPLFAQCLATQCAEVLAETGGDLIELGAGRGILAADLLRELEALNALPNRYRILDVSADLRARQHDTLREHVPHLLDRVEWIDQVPDAFSGVLIANEVIDALPATLWHWHAGALFRRAVDLQDDQFVWTDLPADAALQNWFERSLRPLWEALPEHYLSEWHDCLPGWIALFAKALQHGALIFVDYGFPAREFYLPERNRGTLMCHYRHHAHDQALLLAGLQDVTAHVDFTAVAEAGVEAGLSLLGYTSQAAFLQSLGILQRAQAIQDPHAQIRAAQALKQLLMPHEMGELFKVIALGRGLEQPLRGFALQDRSHQL